MVDILVEATGQTRERLAADMDRDFILRGEWRREYGLSIRSSHGAGNRPVIAAVA
jgi:ATP-dependent protease ClpP protease subunit